MTLHKASCHCGAVRFTVDIDGPIEGAMRCTCSFCRRRAAPNISVPLDRLTITQGADNLTLYTWGTGTAQHYFCRTCGIYTHHQRRSDPNEYGVNLGCIDGQNPAHYEPIPWNDGVNHPSDAKKT